MIDVHVVNKKKQRKYIDSYNTGEKNDWCIHCKQKKKRKNKEIEIFAKIICNKYMFIVK